MDAKSLFCRKILYYSVFRLLYAMRSLSFSRIKSECLSYRMPFAIYKFIKSQEKSVYDLMEQKCLFKLSSAIHFYYTKIYSSI